MVMNKVRRALRSMLSPTLRSSAWGVLHNVMHHSVQRAAKQQHLDGLYRQLTEIVPDIGDQYTTQPVKSAYENSVVRALHAFQMYMTQTALSMLTLDHDRPLVVIDIGDSSGTHLRYLQALYPKSKLKCLSVNVDEHAVERIKAKGLEAVCMKAEDLSRKGFRADLLLCFETLEHLMDPINFLKGLSDTSDCQAFVVTVPYVRQSRVNLQHVRPGVVVDAIPENIHVFELSPDDWRRIFKHSGWKVAGERTYLQYPKFGLLRGTRNLWKNADFEGYWGAILTRDSTWKDLYKGW